MLFTGSSGDGLRIISCIVSRCGFGLAFRPDTGSPPKSPNDVLILMGQFQNCATADILIERQTGGQGAQDYLIAGAKIQGHATLRGIEIDVELTRFGGHLDTGRSSLREGSPNAEGDQIVPTGVPY